jgi:hypothetical protein
MTRSKKGKTPLRDTSHDIQLDVGMSSKDDATGYENNQSGKDPPEKIFSGAIFRPSEDEERDSRSPTFPKLNTSSPKTVRKSTVETENEDSHTESRRQKPTKRDGHKNAVPGSSKGMMTRESGPYDQERTKSPSKDGNKLFLSDTDRERGERAPSRQSQIGSKGTEKDRYIANMSTGLKMIAKQQQSLIKDWNEKQKDIEQRYQDLHSQFVRYQNDVVENNIEHQKNSDAVTEFIEMITSGKFNMSQIDDSSPLTSLTDSNLDDSNRTSNKNRTHSSTENVESNKDDERNAVTDPVLDRAAKLLNRPRQDEESSSMFARRVSASRRFSNVGGRDPPNKQNKFDQQIDRKQMQESLKRAQKQVQEDPATKEKMRIANEAVLNRRNFQKTQEFATDITTRLAVQEMNRQQGLSKEGPRKMIAMKRSDRSDHGRDRRVKGKRREDDEDHRQKNNAAGGYPSDDGDDEDESDSHHSRKTNRSRGNGYNKKRRRGNPDSSPDDDESDQKSRSDKSHRKRSEFRDRNSMFRDFSREQTLGGNHYQMTVLDKYRKAIREKVGRSIDHIPIIKGIKASIPEKYYGDDNIQKFEVWLMSLLRYLRILRVCGDELEDERIILMGESLSGLAAEWYNQEVEDSARTTINWRFEELVCAMYKRFMTDATAQKAANHYERVRFSKSKGALAYWNEMDQAASRMVNRPDDYSMRRDYLKGLPHDIVKQLYKSRGISAEHSSKEEMLDAVKQIESAIQFVQLHAQSSRTNQVPHNKSQNDNQSGYQGPSNKMPNISSNQIRFDSKGKPLPWRYRRINKGKSFKRGSRWRLRSNRFPKKPEVIPLEKRRNNTVPQEKDNSKRDVECFACGQKGHFASDPKCPKYKGPKGEQKRMYAARDENESQEENHKTEEQDENLAQMDETDDDDHLLEGEQYDSSESQESEWVLEQYSEPETEDDEDVVYQRSMRSHIDEDLCMASMREKTNDFETEMDIPYRSRIQSPKHLGERPKYKAKARQCLAGYVKINGIKAYTLFDTGSTFDSISPEFVRVANIKTSKLDNPAGIKLGCVGSRSSINFGCQVDIEAVGEITTTYLDVANIDRYDVILGTSYMYNNKVVLDIYNRTVHFGGTVNKNLKTFSIMEEAEAIAKKNVDNGKSNIYKFKFAEKQGKNPE